MGGEAVERFGMSEHFERRGGTLGFPAGHPVRRCLVAWWATTLIAWTCLGAPKPEQFQESSPGVAHAKDRIERVPWTIEVVRLDRTRTDLEFAPTLGLGNRIGLSRLTAQVRWVPPGVGRAVAAINGDFYKTENEPFPGDPRGLFISRDEVFSAPSGGAVFWIDSNRQLHIAPVESAFEVVWPDNQTSTFGLNELDEESSAILFTSASTIPPLGRRGKLWALEPVNPAQWVPFRIGQTFSAKLGAEVQASGRPIEPAHPWLWVASNARPARDLKSGATIQLKFLSTPALSGVSTAIGGGPVLVSGGVPARPTTNKARERHPRSAMGWNATQFFLVAVDGRQPEHSVGMTLPELAVYMKELGCQEAMNLDGGGSTELWMGGRILNKPCYGHERETATSLVVVRKAADSPKPGPEPAKKAEAATNRN